MKEWLKNGNIFIDKTGGKFDGEKEEVHFALFEYDSNLEGGEGRIYGQNGKKTSYYWAHPKEDGLLSDIPKEVLYSFKHGTRSFYIEKSVLETCKSNLEIVLKSDFEYIDKETVKTNKFILSINTEEKLIKNWDKILENNWYSQKIAELSMGYVGVKVPTIKNGELGYWWMECNGIFLAIKPYITERIKQSLTTEEQ